MASENQIETVLASSNQLKTSQLKSIKTSHIEPEVKVAPVQAREMTLNINYDSAIGIENQRLNRVQTQTVDTQTYSVARNRELRQELANIQAYASRRESDSKKQKLYNPVVLSP